MAGVPPARKVDETPPIGEEMARRRIRRTAPLLKLTTRTVAEAAVAGVRGQLSGPAGGEFHVRTAERYRELLGQSKGALMKAGQMVSLTSAGPVVPAEFQATYSTALASLRDAAPPMAPELTEQVLVRELGDRFAASFAEFDWKPLAAASIGQVHAARLKDGRAVAVKVQYPGVDEAIRNDLKNTQLLASFFSLVAGLLPRRISTDFRGAARGVSEYILEELDYRHEASNQVAFASRYRGHPFIRVPEVIRELTTTRVLTQELCTGSNWAAAIDAEQSLRNRWAEAIWRFIYGSYLRFGLLNMDPHPGNYLFHDDGSVSFLDFGSVKRFPRDQVELTAEIVRGAVHGDARTVWRLCVEAGYWRSSDPVSPEEVLAYWREPFRYVWDRQPFTVTPEYVAHWIECRCSPTGPSANAVCTMTLPLDILGWPRAELSLARMLAELRASNDWGALHAEYSDEGEPASDRGRSDRAFFTAAGASPR